MWLSSKSIFDFFKISQDTVSELRSENRALAVERDHLKAELSKANVLQDWFRVQINLLQMERSALMQKAYGISTPVPELTRPPAAPEGLPDFSFNDIGDEMAKKLGLTVYSSEN